MSTLARVVVSAGLIEGPGADLDGPVAEGRFLVTRRPQGTHLASNWEFPGGKIELGESPEQALVRELQEELGVVVQVGEIFAVGHHLYPERAKEVVLLVFRCRIVSGDPQPLEAEELIWASADELMRLGFPPADQPVLRRLSKALYGQSQRSLKIALPHAGSTRALGRAVGAVVGPGDVLALQGTLGAGKTTLTQGLAVGVDVPEGVYVNSPTFTLIQSYEGGRCPIHHMDFYRLSEPEEAMGLGVEDYLSGAGIVVMEWPDRLGVSLPKQTLTIELTEEGEGRVATLSGLDPRAREIMSRVALAAASIAEAPEPGE
ncbi:MAG: tRNA (adenosine(37)-N6)-threonylcarbamoyltransferase complex ATPase subunit type 1 TsaE [Bradymonadia bacterium]